MISSDKIFDTKTNIMIFEIFVNLHTFSARVDNSRLIVFLLFLCAIFVLIFTVSVLIVFWKIGWQN